MADNSVNNKRIAKNSLFLSIRMVIVLGISLYSTRIILRVLGIEDYGIYNVVAGFVSMFGFLNTSMSNGIQRFFNYELGKNGEEGVNRVFCTSVLIQLLLAVVIILLTESFGIWYMYNKMVIPDDRMVAAGWIFQFAIISFLFTIMQAPFTAAVMAHEHMDFYAVVSVLDAIIKLLVIFLIPIISLDHLIIYGLFIVLISFFNFIVYYIYCHLHFKEIRYHFYFEKKQFRSMLGFSGWNLFGSFSNMMRNQGINLIINLFFGPVVNAARGVAAQINSGVTNLTTSILVPVRPQVIQSYAKGDLNRTMSLTYSISKFSLFFLFLLILPICIELNFILGVWLGDNIPEHTQSFCLIILVTTAVLIPMNALSTLVHASGNMRNYQVIGSVVKFLSVPCAYVMLYFGLEPEWAFIMVLVFDIIGFIVGLFIIRTLMPFSIISYVTRVFLPLLPVFTIGIFSSWFVHNMIDNNVARFLTVLFTGFVFSVLSFYYIALIRSERNLLAGFLSKILHKIKIKHIQ